MYFFTSFGYFSNSSCSDNSDTIAHFSCPIYPVYSYFRLMSLQSFAKSSSCFFNVFSFVMFVISLNFLKFLFYIENSEITGIWRCTSATFFSSVSPFRSNKKIAEHQEYAGSGYPIILNVRLFGNSYRFRGSVQSSVIQLSAQSVLILNFLSNS